MNYAPNAESFAYKLGASIRGLFIYLASNPLLVLVAILLAVIIYLLIKKRGQRATASLPAKTDVPVNNKNTAYIVAIAAAIIAGLIIAAVIINGVLKKGAAPILSEKEAYAKKLASMPTDEMLAEGNKVIAAAEAAIPMVGIVKADGEIAGEKAAVFYEITTVSGKEIVLTFKYDRRHPDAEIQLAHMALKNNPGAGDHAEYINTAEGERIEVHFIYDEGATEARHVTINNESETDGTHELIALSKGGNELLFTFDLKDGQILSVMIAPKEMPYADLKPTKE
jgi:hypothetical protein